MRLILGTAGLALLLTACAPTTGRHSPTARSVQQQAWRPKTDVPAKPLAGPPRKPVLTGELGSKPPTL